MTHGSTCERMALRSCLHHQLPPRMGVRTVQAIDTARDGRPLTFELRYLAAECDAGRDVSSSQGTVQVLHHWPPRCAMPFCALAPIRASPFPTAVGAPSTVDVFLYASRQSCRGYAALLNRSRAESASDRPLKLRHRLS
jgi:hypothetical protein